MTEETQHVTGVPNTEYDLISVLYHSLQGAETFGDYAQDAQDEGDQELADFLREAQPQSADCAQRAKQLLASRLQPGAGAGAGTTAGRVATQATAMGHAGDKPKVK
jgi:hypothetical protein